MPDSTDVTSGLLGSMFAAYEQRLRAHISQHDYMVIPGGGTIANLQQGITWMMTLGDPMTLMNGCLALQSETFDVCNQNRPAGYAVKKLMVGFGMEHHAVAVYPENLNPQAGFVFDAWITQSPQVYTYNEWLSGFGILNAISEVRLEN